MGVLRADDDIDVEYVDNNNNNNNNNQFSNTLFAQIKCHIIYLIVPILLSGLTLIIINKQFTKKKKSERKIYITKTDYLLAMPLCVIYYIILTKIFKHISQSITPILVVSIVSVWPFAIIYNHIFKLNNRPINYFVISSLTWITIIMVLFIYYLFIHLNKKI